MAAAMNEGKAAYAEANGEVVEETEPASSEEVAEVVAEAVAEGESEVVETEEV